jgi:serine/threonine-protein kinase
VNEPTAIPRKLQHGDRLGPYEVLDALGAGGMGEVYRARDTKLRRDVAIKVLPPSVARDPDRLQRFEREAHLLASLNHPHIAAIYGVEESAGIVALVLELVEGVTLADRVAAGPLPVDEALAIARQIAEALESAHERGIIHRDLKPANVKLTPDGTVKVLDFGLAKVEASAANLSESPTITALATREGVILGTAPYMSPEQARGKDVDKRADIWAFGCVVYELLTGARAFPGETTTDVLAAVVNREPDYWALPPATPPVIRRMLARCLDKDPKRRLRDIGDARLDIEDVLNGAASEAAAAPAPLARHALARSVIGVFGLAMGAALVLLLWSPWRIAPLSGLTRLNAELGADVSLVTNEGASAVLSPNGEVLAFVAQKSLGEPSQLYVRRLDELVATPLAGTGGALNPFFSPDGEWIAFFADGKLKKISVAAHSVVTLCDAPTGRGGSWADDGTIAFSPAAGAVRLMRVSADGGAPEPLMNDADGFQRWPQVLPGGKAVLYTGAPVDGWNNASLIVQPLPAGERKVVQRNAYYGRYLSSGHLVYVHEGALFAAPFDLDALEVTGPAVRALQGVTANATVTGGAQFAVSGTGTLVYLPGENATRELSISWMDRTGQTTPLGATPADWLDPVFSPDGRQLAMSILERGHRDVWIYDWMRDTPSRLTVDRANDEAPVWTPDGRRIAFASQRGDGATYSLYLQRADGMGEAQRLTEGRKSQFPESWHPTGKFLAFTEDGTHPGDHNIMMLPVVGDEATGWTAGEPTVFLGTPANEGAPMFSPDGRWLAYSSGESGRYEVYVRPFPGPGGKWQISAGGTTPIWSPRRRELFYSTSDRRIMVASYTVEGESFRAEKPRLWTERRFTQRINAIAPRSLGLHPDGDRFALAASPETGVSADQNKVVFVFNFFDELRRIAPPTRR